MSRGEMLRGMRSSSHWVRSLRELRRRPPMSNRSLRMACPQRFKTLQLNRPENAAQVTRKTLGMSDEMRGLLCEQGIDERGAGQATEAHLERVAHQAVAGIDIGQTKHVSQLMSGNGQQIHAAA